jgi:hypothetical protein
MNRVELAAEVGEFIKTSIADNDEDEVDLAEAATQVEDFIEGLEDAEDEAEGEAEAEGGTEE